MLYVENHLGHVWAPPSIDPLATGLGRGSSRLLWAHRAPRPSYSGPSPSSAPLPPRRWWRPCPSRSAEHFW